MKQKIGIFGGSFNPVHFAHLKVADHFVNDLNLDLCLFIPANISPFKINEHNLNIISNKHRLEMLRLAIENYEKFQLETYELTQDKVSYSIDTLKYLKRKYKDSIFYLLIGSDQAYLFSKWKNWIEILMLCQICIVKKPDFDSSEIINKINRFFNDNNYKPIFINMPLLNINSTMIRDKISKNESIETLTPQEVINYIKVNNLYK